MTEPMVVSIAEAASLLGVHRNTILNYLSQGKLEATKMGKARQARRLVIYASLKKLLDPNKEAA